MNVSFVSDGPLFVRQEELEGLFLCLKVNDLKSKI
jgi:hypothetical protein